MFGPTIATGPLDGEKGREERGAFYTPDLLAHAIARTLKVEGVNPARVFEPGCGGGSFLRAAHATWPTCDLIGIDLAPACNGPGLVLTGDLFKQTIARFDLVLGNPDYTIAEAAVRHCLGLLAPGGVLAFLLRAAFNGSTGRVPLYREHPLWLYVPIAQRPSFTEDGRTDPMEYALFCWRQGHTGDRGTHLSPLVWR